MDSIIDTKFDKIIVREQPLSKGEYDQCTFNQCDFSESDLAGFKFLQCTFNACNISMAKLPKTSFQDTLFKDCKMLGLRFDQCHDFALSFAFDSCILNHSSFFKLKIKKTVFRNCQLHQTDFTECDLTAATLHECDLRDATFERSILEKADFRTAFNYSFDPEINRIKKAKFSIPGVVGLLNKYDIEIQ